MVADCLLIRLTRQDLDYYFCEKVNGKTGSLFLNNGLILYTRDCHPINLMALCGGLTESKLLKVFLRIFILLMDLVCLAILCLQVTNPLIYFAAGGSYVLFAILLIIYLMKSGALVDLTPERIKGNKTTIWIYLVFMVLCYSAAANLFWIPSAATEIGWGIFALLASIAAMTMQHYGMKQERKDLGIP